MFGDSDFIFLIVGWAWYSHGMRWTIGKRLFAALTVASLVIVGLNAAATRWNFHRGFSDYL